jgi:hypothetical protein
VVGTGESGGFQGKEVADKPDKILCNNSAGMGMIKGKGKMNSKHILKKI